MIKIIVVSFLFCFSIAGFTQSEYIFHPKHKGDKYFISLAYGQGTARWISIFQNTEFYDKDGGALHKGDLLIRAKCPTKHVDVNVSAPIKNIRVGFGISFENHYLTELILYNKDGSDYLLFDESMRFDKIYLHVEAPFKFDSPKKYSFGANLRFGWFEYSNVKRINFLSDNPFSFSMLTALGITADYEIYKGIYTFLFPNVEYKYYDNSRSENPVQIQHNVFTFNALLGVRVDLGKAFN